MGQHGGWIRGAWGLGRGGGWGSMGGGAAWDSMGLGQHGGC